MMNITLKLLKIFTKFIICSTVLLIIYNSQYTTTLDDETNAASFPIHDSDNLKYILIWNRDAEFNFLKRGQEVFRKHDCEFRNCFVSKHRNRLHRDYRNYHAILFSGKTMVNKFVDGYFKLPVRREPHQTYIFGMQDDSLRNPVCDEKFDNYFNLTWTYKLDSDVIWPFFNVIELDTAKVVSPNMNVTWKKKTKPNDMMFEVQERLINKKHYALWVSSDCKTPSVREEVVAEIKESSQAFGYKLDIIGDCGIKCNETNNGCLKLLNSYIFYMAFESVLAEDYVTDEVVDAMRQFCLPVVYGAANYSRFLPPHSFIDATKLGPKETAKLMARVMKNVPLYFSYFNWRMTYGIKKDDGAAACDLCKALNQNKERVHENFRKWWNPDYEETCKTKMHKRRYYRLNYHNADQPPRKNKSNTNAER